MFVSCLNLPQCQKTCKPRYFQISNFEQGPTPLIHENREFLQFLRHASPRPQQGATGITGVLSPGDLTRDDVVVGVGIIAFDRRFVEHVECVLQIPTCTTTLFPTPLPVDYFSF